MTKSTKQILIEADLQSSPNSPAVIAYRLGQVEDAVKEGFKAHDAKLDSLVNGFVSKAEFAPWVNDVVSLKSDRKWLVRLVLGAVFVELLGLVGAGITLNK